MAEPEAQNDAADLALRFVPPDEREAVRNFEAEIEADLAAGYLRSQGIAAEVGTMMIPGLQYDIALWVRRADADDARRLLDQADASARGPQPVD
ncbi:MAG TPA: hypothetical protein VMV31_10750 [Terriglobales bacterium]|nr:hypothetical protein [Terriglobales bacterium]